MIQKRFIELLFRSDSVLVGLLQNMQVIENITLMFIYSLVTIS